MLILSCSSKLQLLEGVLQQGLPKTLPVMLGFPSPEGPLQPPHTHPGTGLGGGGPYVPWVTGGQWAKGRGVVRAPPGSLMPSWDSWPLVWHWPFCQGLHPPPLPPPS